MAQRKYNRKPISNSLVYARHFCMHATHGERLDVPNAMVVNETKCLFKALWTKYNKFKWSKRAD